MTVAHLEMTTIVEFLTANKCGRIEAAHLMISSNMGLKRGYTRTERLLRDLDL
jgi:hypothetical protein